MWYVPREWSPSFVDIDRIGTMCSIMRDSFGSVSQICIPGTDVEIGLSGPPLTWSGFTSNVSI